jgi:tetratricopeptide (TPR) repeat protein
MLGLRAYRTAVAAGDNAAVSRRKPRTARNAPRATGESTRVAAAAAPRGRSAIYVLPLFVAAVLLAYQPVWHGGELWDDDGHITSPELRSNDGLARIWFELGATQQYYPVVHSAFWLFARLWGDDTLGYHLVNIVLHAFSGVLVVVILRRLEVPGALLAGALFALHPVHVESVAWMTELKNTMSGALYLLSALAYLHFDDSRRRTTYAVALVLFALALLSKSVTATLPAALLVVFWWRRGRVDWSRDVVPLVPFFALGLSSGLLTAWVERTFIGARGAGFDLTVLERGLIAGRAAWFYLSKLLWPVNLIFVYPRWNVSQAVWWQYLFPLALVALLAFAWRYRTTSRAPLAALLLFCGTLLPALGFVNVFPFRYSFVADHFQYLASIPMLALAAAGLTALARRWLPAPAPAIAAAAVLLGVLGSLTWLQSRQYVSAETLYRETIARNPGAWMAYNNLGSLKLQGSSTSARDASEAAELVQQALRLFPDNPEAHNSLGVAYQRLGRLDAAEREHQEALRLLPSYAGAYNNLGIVAEQQGHLEDAVHYYSTALRLHKRERDRVEAYHNMGSVLRKLGRYDEAIAQIEAALRINPDYADAHGNLAMALVRAGRPDEAIQHYREALRLKPDYAEAHNDFGTLLATVGRLDEAVAEFTEALRLKPDSALPRVNLADALRRLGRRDDAISHLNAAIRLQPNLAFAHYSLGNVLAETGQLDAAVRAYQSAIRFEPDATSYAIHNDLGVALAQLGRRVDARAEFERALRIKPDFEDARRNLARVR